MISNFTRLVWVALSLVVSAGAAAGASATEPDKGSSTVSMQGGEDAWIKDPHMHQFYALTVAAFADGPKAVDKARYEADAVAIFRDFGRSTGVGADAMADHLKLIPDQVIQIATEDPKVLASYDNFIAALLGPR